MAEVKPITYSLQFRGRATPLASNLVRLELTAPSAALVTTIGAMGIRTRFDDVLGGEAVLRSETSFDELSFDDRGTIEFGRGNTLHFRSIGSRLTPCPDPGLRHGIVIRRVEGGDGQFAGCEGLIASNFLISDTGEVTENHAGVIFVAPAPTTPCTDGVFARESPNEKRRSRLGAWRLTRAWRSSGTQPSSSEPVTPIQTNWSSAGEGWCQRSSRHPPVRSKLLFPPFRSTRVKTMRVTAGLRALTIARGSRLSPSHDSTIVVC